MEVIDQLDRSHEKGKRRKKRWGKKGIKSPEENRENQVSGIERNRAGKEAAEACPPFLPTVLCCNF